MIQKLFSQLFKHKIKIGALILVAGGLGYWGYNQLFKEEEPIRYASAQIQKGTLVVSVAGNGQIDVSEKIDLKPEVSGKVIAVYVQKDQEIKTGTLIASLNSRDAARTVSDAELSLESAIIGLEELRRGADAQSMMQAENALAQAERSLEKAQLTYDNIEIEAQKTLNSAYDSGYNEVSTSFFKLAEYIKDLQDVLGNDQYEQEHVYAYKNILGSSSPFIQKFLDDYGRAIDLYNENFSFFRTTSRDDDSDTIYELLNNTIEASRMISQALESARHMYDAIVTKEYNKYVIASTVDRLKPKIESDISSAFSTISSLERVVETIDTTVEETPGKIKDAELSLASAKETLASRQLTLAELQAGTDDLDIRTQQNIVAQKEVALLEAREKLAAHFIRAPFDGVIGEINVKAEDSVSSGTILASLTVEQYIAEITLHEIDVAKVKLGQPATLTFDAIDGLTLTGKVSDISNTASINQGVVTYKTIITLDTLDELIRPGMTVNATIVSQAKPDILLVPNSALKYQNGVNYVEAPHSLDRQIALTNSSNAIFNNSLNQLPVEIGLVNDEYTEIISGLVEGDLVITRSLQPSTTQNTQTQSNFNIPGLNTGAGGTGAFRAMR